MSRLLRVVPGHAFSTAVIQVTDRKPHHALQHITVCLSALLAAQFSGRVTLKPTYITSTVVKQFCETMTLFPHATITLACGDSLELCDEPLLKTLSGLKEGDEDFLRAPVTASWLFVPATPGVCLRNVIGSFEGIGKLAVGYPSSYVNSLRSCIDPGDDDDPADYDNRTPPAGFSLSQIEDATGLDVLDWSTRIRPSDSIGSLLTLTSLKELRLPRVSHEAWNGLSNVLPYMASLTALGMLVMDEGADDAADDTPLSRLTPLRYGRLSVSN